MDDAEPFGFLIATQRSGTGVLGTVLNRNRDLKYIGEVFHPSNVGDEGNYFSFLRDAIGTEPDLAMPWRSEDAFRRFVAEQRARHASRTVVLDVKYGSLHHLNQGWQGLGEAPWLLRFARHYGAPIIHLTRRNFIECFVSGRLAEANQIWHTDDPSASRVRSVVVDIPLLQLFVAGLAEETRLMEIWTGGYKKLVHVEYAEMFDTSGALSATCAEAISRAFSASAFTDRKPNLVKQAPDRLDESIENYDEVRAAFAGTPHAWMTP